MRKHIELAMGVLILIFVNVVIFQREQLRAHGQVALLELVREINEDVISSSGRLVLHLDTRRIARFARINEGTPLHADEMVLRYRVRNGRLKLATNAFFFQEGSGDAYTGARYGEFRVDTRGNALLTGLRDENLLALPHAAQ